MQSIKKLSLLAACVLCLPVHAQSEQIASTWGNWANAQSSQDSYFATQTVSNAELIDTEISQLSIANPNLALGTQLVGSASQGLDTDQVIELNDQGVPIELANQQPSIVQDVVIIADPDNAIPVDVGEIVLNQDGVPLELAN